MNRLGFNEVQAADAKAFHDMQQAQNRMHVNPGQVELADAELQACADYRLKHLIYTEFLRRKEKLEWIRHHNKNPPF